MTKLTAIEVQALRIIRNLNEEAKLEAIKAMQLAAVKLNGTAIDYIEDPTEAVRYDYIKRWNLNLYKVLQDIQDKKE